jgi:peptidoglycan hydrolase-like protein with peptidoglycan-binding domain
MNGELHFEAMPFEAYNDASRTPASEQSAFELEEEFGRRSRPRRPGFASRGSRVTAKRPSRPPVLPQREGKPPVFPPPFPPYPPGWPRGVVGWPVGVVAEPYAVAPEPSSAGPLPTGSEYMRWVQSALNDTLDLRLPVHGIADAATRNAVRSFQRREGLFADGIVGPDTERALIAARKAPQERATAPTEPADATPTTPAGELNFEWESSAREFDEARRISERAAVKSRIAAGQRDSNTLTDMVFFQRHPERRGHRLGADEYKYIHEWQAVLRDIVMPELAHRSTPCAARPKISDGEIRATLDMAAKKIPSLGITIEELLLRHQSEAREIPIEVLLAFIHFEAGSLFDDATAGKWSAKHNRYIPSFYELGVFQTPGGDHGCTNEAGAKICRYRPPGRRVENSQFGKGWRRFAGAYPTESNWKDPTMQVRVGLWDLNSTADRVYAEFPALFPSKQSEWFLRMAVLYSFAAGAGAARLFLRKFENELSALPEAKRWDFLRGKNVGTTYFNPENVDKKIALAARLRAVRGMAVG